MTEYASFYIVRHGETDWNSQKRVQGQSDIPLNVIGETQAASLAEKFRDHNFDLAFSSDLLRAKRTADIVGLEHNLAVESTNLLRERNFGKFEGQQTSAFQAYDALYATLSDEEKRTYKYEGDVESDEELISRTITFIRETAITHPDKKILIATHGGVMRTLLRHLGFARYNEDIVIANTAYIVLESDGVDFNITEMNGIEKRSMEELIKSR